MNVSEWIQRVPMLLDACGRERKTLREFVVHLASYASADGSDIYPTVNRVADELNLHRRTVLRLYREAEEAKQVLSDGKRTRSTIPVRLNMDLPFETEWFPARQVKIDRRAKTAARVARHRAAKAAERDTTPVTTTPNGAAEVDSTPVTATPQADTTPVTACATPLMHQQENHHQTSAAAAASPAEIIDAELIDDDGLPGMDGPPLLTIEPPAAGALVPATASVPAVPDLSASWLLPEPEETGKRKRSAPIDAPRFDAEAWRMPREQHTPSEWTKTLVGLYVEAARSFGFEPSSRQISQVGREVKGLVAAGNNPVHILAAVQRAAEKRGAWVMRAMADVQPGNWSAQRKGRQIITTQGPVQLPEGMSAGDRRAASIAAWS